MSTVDVDALIKRKWLSHPDVQEYMTWLESELRAMQRAAKVRRSELRTLTTKLEQAEALMRTAYDDGEAAITRVGELELSLKCLEESTVDSKAYAAQTQRITELEAENEEFIKGYQLAADATGYDGDWFEAAPICILTADRDNWTQSANHWMKNFGELKTQLHEAEAMLAVKPSAMEYAELQSQHQWHRVEDELPPGDTVVLVQGGIAHRYNGQWRSLTSTDWPGRPITWEVTHWMPLPSPPETGE